MASDQDLLSQAPLCVKNDTSLINNEIKCHIGVWVLRGQLIYKNNLMGFCTQNIVRRKIHSNEPQSKTIGGKPECQIGCL